MKRVILVIVLVFALGGCASKSSAPSIFVGMGLGGGGVNLGVSQNIGGINIGASKNIN